MEAGIADGMVLGNAEGMDFITKPKQAVFVSGAIA
jgi:hypothetical protein